MGDVVTVNDILKLREPCESFLCPLDANRHGIKFLKFVIKDFDTKEVFFNVDKKNPSMIAGMKPVDGSLDTARRKKELLREYSRMCARSEDSIRIIQYDFPVDVLLAKSISTELTFSIGKRPVENFRMIERHYFKGKLVKNYDFTFGFCVPNSTNSWEAIYNVPLLDSKTIDEMVANPYETVSDSFYFVDDILVLHNKAQYSYSDRTMCASPVKLAKGLEQKSENEEKVGSKKSIYSSKNSGGLKSPRESKVVEAKSSF